MFEKQKQKNKNKKIKHVSRRLVYCSCAAKTCSKQSNCYSVGTGWPGCKPLLEIYCLHFFHVLFFFLENYKDFICKLNCFTCLRFHCILYNGGKKQDYVFSVLKFVEEPRVWRTWWIYWTILLAHHSRPLRLPLCTGGTSNRILVTGPKNPWWHATLHMGQGPNFWLLRRSRLTMKLGRLDQAKTFFFLINCQLISHIFQLTCLQGSHVHRVIWKVMECANAFV